MLRLVLRPEVSRDAIDDAVVALGWQLTNILPATPTDPAQIVFATATGDGYLHLVDDPRVGARYFTAAPRHANELATLAQHVSSWDVAALRATLASARDDVLAVEALLALALALASEPSEADVAAFERALGAPALEVRAAALAAAGSAGWRELGPALAERARMEPDATLRAHAAALAAACRVHA